MATYADLQTRVRDFLNRADLPSNTADFIMGLAVREMYQAHRWPRLSTRAVFAWPADTDFQLVSSIIANFERELGVYFNAEVTDETLEINPDDLVEILKTDEQRWVDRNTAVSRSLYHYYFGHDVNGDDAFFIVPEPSANRVVVVDYLPTHDTLDPSLVSTNFFTENYPDALFYKAMHIGAMYYKQFALGQFWERLWQDKLRKSINREVAIRGQNRTRTMGKARL